MQITDYNVTYSKDEFMIERDDSDVAFCSISDFLQFLSEWKGWFYDKENQRICIPTEATEYDKERKVFYTATLAVRTYNFSLFCELHRKELPGFFESYAECAELEWEMQQQPPYEDSQEEAWREFRRMNKV